jgi:hypothetical protein
MKKQTKNRKNKEQQRSVIPRSVGERSPDRLPQLNDQLQTGITLRYITTGTGGSASTTITFTNLLDSWCVASSATAAYQLFDFVKVRRVTIRAVSNPALAGNIAFLGAAATVGIEFPSLVVGTQAGGVQASQTEMGTAQIACCSLRPGRLTAAGMWQASTSNVAFVLRAVDWNGGVIVGAVIDVELSFKNSADVNPAAVASAPAGATTGNVYFRGIDGAAPAATWARSAFVPRI